MMGRSQTEYNKKLVRNVTCAVPKVIVRSEPSVPKISNAKPTVKEKGAKSLPSPNFAEPKVYSTSTLAKQIESLENIKLGTCKSASNVTKSEKLAVNEKVTRQVNFPYNKTIFKDLIPLCVKSGSSQLPVTRVRDPLPPKDIEPQLSDFLKPVAVPIEIHTAEISQEIDIPERSVDLLRLTRKITTWNNF